MPDPCGDGRHLALLVEDDPAMADELRELLSVVLGYEVIHESNLEDAKSTIDLGDFCFVILDLQIFPSPGSIKPRVEAGHALLQHIRERYPGRGRNDFHRLPVIVVSGHAKEHPAVVRAMQLGASDLLVKPLSLNPRPLEEHIADALRRSGRELHASCEAAMSGARGATTGPRAVTLVITGDRVRARTRLRIDGRDTLVTDEVLKVLVKLVEARLTTPDGWVHKLELSARSDQGWKGISRARQQLQTSQYGGPPLYENDHQGSYRLHHEIELGSIEWDALLTHSSAAVRAVASRFHTRKTGSSGPDER